MHGIRVSPARHRLLRLGWISVSLLAGISLALVAAGWWSLRASRPQLTGESALPGLSAPVRIARDARGVPAVQAATRRDAARATGFLHAQERFFQMDLLRRRAAGELAALFGERAVALDRSTRPHGFRERAREVVARLPAARREVLAAYVEGVNAGLRALPVRPWEYLLLREPPQPWQPEDTVLCMYAMWLDLQDEDAGYERSLQALYETGGPAAVDFLAGLQIPDDAAIDGTQLLAAALPPALPTVATAAAQHSRDGLEPPFHVGSNSFAVAGALTGHGAALLANDMHLALRVPNVWYQAELRWTDPQGRSRRVVGATLPGTPAMVVGSNGAVAWGFTNANVDTVDARPVAATEIRVLRTERIAVRGGEAIDLPVRVTDWGPVVTDPQDAVQYAVRWNAHHPDAANLEVMALEDVADVDAALDAAHRAGMPNQNLLAADATGRIGWTVTGFIPQRAGTDGRLPRDSDATAARWTGWLPPDEVPVVRDPADGLLWTANNRIVGGAALAKLGDSGYDSALRARSIRNDLRALAGRGPVDEAGLLGVQLADRAPHLRRWQALLLQVLQRPAFATDPRAAAMRREVEAWQGRATPDSAGYRLIRAFRAQVGERTVAPWLAAARERYAEVDFGRFRLEEPVWRLLQARPATLLDPALPAADWDRLLDSAVVAALDAAGSRPQDVAAWTWGRRNTLRMEHPIAAALPGWLARHLNMPAEALPGDAEMARYQSPGGGASQRLVVAPGREEQGIFHMPGGQSGHPLSPYYGGSHAAWAEGRPAALLAGTTVWELMLQP
ncbi:MAG: Acyl-homoserine lactone acylase QuiP precursor [Pseudomonadota bacterium]